MDAAEIIKRADKAKQERSRLEGVLDDAMRLTMPTRKRFVDTGDVNIDDVFDETGANGTSEFVSRMQAGIVPPWTEFVKLEASSLVDDRDKDAVNRDLEEIQKFAFEEIWSSNFALESAESFYDMAMTAGIMAVEDGDMNALHHKAVPITEAYLELGPNDRPNGTFRAASVKAQNLEHRYRGAKFSGDTQRMIDREKDRDLEVIEYTYRDFSRRDDEVNFHRVLVKETKDVIVDRELKGEGSNPFMSFRWSTVAGEAWGRGPLMNAMAAIRTTNLMVELVLENAAMSIVGVYQTDNDGVMNADQISLLPGTILAKEIGTKGLEQVGTATGNFNMRDVVLNDQRLNIKRALFNDMLADPGKTPATATEVAERMADLAYRSSAGFSRIFYEFVQPYMVRVLYLLQKRGDIELPTKNGRAISFRAVSPLAQAQMGRDIQRLATDFQLRAQMFGPGSAAAMYDLEKLHPWLQERLGLASNLYKTPAEIVKALEKQAQSIAQMQAMQQGVPTQ